METPIIDPVEAALAVIGVRPILSREVEKVLMIQVREMHELPKTIVKEAKLVVRGEKSSIPFGSVSYKKMLHDLTEDFNEQQLEEMVSKFPTALHAITSNFIVDAKKLIVFLRQLLPMQTKQTLLGPENIMPSAMAIRRFATTVDVLDNPMRVFAHIASGSLLKSQATAVQTVYPTISKAIDVALEEAGADEKANKASFQLPSLVTIGWYAWKGIPRVPPKLQQALQANFAKAQAEQPKPENQASGGQQSIIAKESMTNVQRSLYPSQTSKAG